MNYDCIVVGGGINGLATAHALLKLGVTSLALLEQFSLGHGQGSSHGRSRITRSSYTSPKYVELMQLVHKTLWPEWEAEAGQVLLHPNPGIFFGPGIDPYRDGLHGVPQVLEFAKALGLPGNCHLCELAEGKDGLPLGATITIPSATLRVVQVIADR